MRLTKYFLQALIEVNSGDRETMNVTLPMNTPIMLVRVGGQMRIKKLSGTDHPHKTIEPAHPNQVSLL